MPRQVRVAFQLCLSRPPARAELADARAFIAAQTDARERREASPPGAARQHALTDFCQSLFGLNEFIYVD